MRKQAAELADLLGGVLACTRPLVEGNIFDAKHQIGLSGRTVKPKLIICLGISGAVQFAAGMKSSDCIVAINSDPAAPIFDIAHYGIVGDVNEIVPKFIDKVREDRHV
jgi:electron transfer flavoprotein alpha subunit